MKKPEPILPKINQEKPKRKEINLSDLKKALEASLQKESLKYPEKEEESQVVAKEEKPKEDDKKEGVINPGQKIIL